MTSLSSFDDFPEFPFADELCVPVVKYKGVTISEGMWAVWEDDSDPFRIEAIRLNPTLRFWTGQEWVLASGCSVI